MMDTSTCGWRLMFFSRKIRGQPLKDKTSKGAASALMKLIDFGKLDFPIKIWVDKGKEFQASLQNFVPSMR